MSTHLTDVVDHELAERRKSSIYFAILAIAAVFIAAALLYVLR